MPSTKKPDQNSKESFWEGISIVFRAMFADDPEELLGAYYSEIEDELIAGRKKLAKLRAADVRLERQIETLNEEVGDNPQELSQLIELLEQVREEHTQLLTKVTRLEKRYERFPSSERINIAKEKARQETEKGPEILSINKRVPERRNKLELGPIDDLITKAFCLFLLATVLLMIGITVFFLP